MTFIDHLNTIQFMIVWGTAVLLVVFAIVAWDMYRA